MATPQQIIQLTEIIRNHIPEILNSLDIKYHDDGASVCLACPIHGSKRNNSVTMYKNTGLWRCWTNSCHEDYGQGLIDFVKAFYEVVDNKKMTTNQVIDKICKLLKINLKTLKQSEDFQYKFSSMILSNHLSKDVKSQTAKMNRNTIRERLYIPAKYYISRGFSSEILDKYDVGLCNSYGKEMFGRIVVPIYDNDYKYMIGCVGRSQYKECEKCGKYHGDKQGCPTNGIEEMWASKWKNSLNFKSDSTFYNYWFAKEEIKKTGTAILVEGQGDIWKLVEAGINCGLGVFGAKISEGQLIILEKSPIRNIILGCDNDEAGRIFREKARAKLSRLFNIVDIIPEEKDFGEMSVDKVKQAFMPILEKLS